MLLIFKIFKMLFLLKPFNTINEKLICQIRRLYIKFSPRRLYKNIVNIHFNSSCIVRF